MDSGDADPPYSAPHPARAIEGRDAPEQTDPAQGRPDATPDERDKQIAEHVRYRLSVEASYQAAEARSSWTEAAPVLRAEWEAHKQRYPDRERQAAATLPDGSANRREVGRRLAHLVSFSADKVGLPGSTRKRPRRPNSALHTSSVRALREIPHDQGRNRPAQTSLS